VASDKDGDGVTFGFVGGSSTSGLFRIEENTGVIRLISGSIMLDRDKVRIWSRFPVEMFYDNFGLNFIRKLLTITYVCS
jgi:hypothetical protein